MKISLKKSLMTRLLTVFFLISFLPALTIGLANMAYVRIHDRTSIFSELEGINKSKSTQIRQFLDTSVQKALSLGHQTEVESLSSAVHDLIRQHPLDSKEFAEKYAKYQKDFEPIIHNAHVIAGFIEINIITNEGVMVFSEHTDEILLDKSQSEEARKLHQIWTDIRKSGKPAFYDFEFDDDIGDMVMHMGVPLYDSAGKLSDIMILGLSRDQINMITTFEFGQYETRESFLLSSEDRIISDPLYPERSKTFGSVYDNAILPKAKQAEQFIDIIDAVIENKKIIFASETIHLDKIEDFSADFNWTIITQMDNREFVDPINQQRLFLFLFLIGVLAVVMIIGYRMIRNIVNPLILLNREVNRLSSGSLDITLSSDRKDEIGSLINNTDFMIKRISEIIKAIKDIAADTGNVASSVAVSAEEQSAISVEQAGSITEISSTMDEFTTSMIQVADNAKAVSETFSGMFQHVRESSSLIDSTAENISFISDDNERNIDNIMNLKQRSQDISKVMEIISNISDQTKIIAFNAALEASSAGEYGKRFGVVAAEIRRLAENVISSTSSIDTIINDIQKLADQMVVASEKTTKNINQGLRNSKESVETMNTVVESIENSHESTKQIAFSVQQQQSAAAQIQSGLKEISLGAQQNSEAIQGLNETGRKFAKLGQQLSRMTRRFTLPEEVSPALKPTEEEDV
ncbi:MAG: methyl-accepting chemotaxis protein [Sphaerochaeta sp.]|nr:methyl-accepting chemotaxis protein [Sphaerochaeta sp.]